MSYYSIPAIVIEYIEYMYQLNQFADWLQRHTKTDIRYLAKGGFWVGIGHSAEMIGGIVVTIALANLLPKDVLGTYQYVLATALLLGAFTLTGMRAALIRAVAQGDKGLLRYAVITKLKWNLGIVAAAGAVAGYYYFMGNNTLGTAFLIVGTTAPFLESFRLYQAYLIGSERFRLNAMLAILRRGLPTIAMVLTAVYTTDILTLILTYFSINLIAVSIVLWLTARNVTAKPTTDKSMVGYSKHLSLMATLSQFSAQADKLLLWHYLGPVAVATFTIAQLPTRYTSSSVGILRYLVLPKLAQRDFTTLKQTLPRKVFLFFLITVAATAVYILLAPWLFSFVFPTYPEAVAISQVLALTLLFVPRSAFAQALTAHSKKKALYTISVTSNLLKIASLIILLPIFGIWGAVYALLFTELVSVLLMSILFYRTS
jgi:O-antigen/teichoic acid export membrane protein